MSRNKVNTIETLDQYPRHIVFEVFGKDHIQEFNIQYNELIDVHIDINSPAMEAEVVQHYPCMEGGKIC